MQRKMKRKMKKDKVYQSYDKWDHYSLATLAGRTLGLMTDNPNFPDPRPDLESYGAAVNDFIAKHEIASNGGSFVERTARDNSRVLLEKLIRQLAFYVNTVADGDPHILAGSGFEIIPESRSAGYPGQVVGVWVRDGRKSGELRFGFAVIRSAKEYEYQLAGQLGEIGEPLWGESWRTSTSRMNYIDNLVPGQRYYIHVRARNAKGIGDWSEPVSFIVR